MAILTGAAFCACALCFLMMEIFKAAGKKELSEGVALGVLVELALLILCAGHWMAVLLGRL